MKRINIIIAALLIGITACVDLNQEPKTSLPGEAYFTTDAQLQTYIDNLYLDVFTTHGSWSYGNYGIDANSDNMASTSASSIYRPADFKVAQSGGDWSFTYIYRCNYFFYFVLPKYEAGAISGNTALINHLVGEAYFLRALAYFGKLQSLGDFPIITEILQDDMATLTEASKRQPRTEVAHFILEELDKAIALLNDNVAKTRITKKAAQLLKSRVALFEGTWLKYFKGTPFVPLGAGWPGATAHPGYQFPKGSIDAEIAFFFDEAMAAAKAVASTTALVANNGVLPQSLSDPENLFLKMFGDVNLSGYSEVILWRQYNQGLGITHNIPSYTTAGCAKTGLTRAYVDNFLMDDGSPIYASGGRYQGDDSLNCVRVNRDGRLQLFLKVPGDVNYYQAGSPPERCYNVIEPLPDLVLGDAEKGYNTGYTLRKGYNPTFAQMNVNNGSYTGCIVYRAAEAYLNYIEACYEKNGSLDADAKDYWVKIRSRANATSVTWASIEANTINKTVIASEIPNDLAAYSAGAPLTDPVLYSIRRERRMELLADGMRLFDLKRWRALDRLVNTPYTVEGCKFWGPKFHVYTINAGGAVTVARPIDNEAYFTGVVSPSSAGLYVRPYEIKPTDPVAIQGGLKWKMGHYLNPIAVDHFLITSQNGTDADTSPIYQNPYWPIQSEANATE
ncbi:MAG: RagB/SusD family nutrient uptake outer membrane protein [Odoribacteraceae bacterium]|jgi:hypothetical protein|nr:RagB/SusD family nutrient uptake outer membrane protein [Odoribacteraceae bacterium]